MADDSGPASPAARTQRDDWRLRMITSLARRMPHPDPPTARYLATRRGERTPPWLTRRLLGPVRRDVRSADFTVPGPDGHAVPVRSYQPWPRQGGRLPLVLCFHGGGFVIGSLTETDWLCGQLAARLPAVIMSVGYRLAPEHPAPLPFEDCWAATSWLSEHAGAWAADPAAVTVLGTSAGANLAALVALAHRDLVRDRPELPPLAHQVLVYPATDLTLASPSLAEFADDPFLSSATLDWFGRQYLPQGLPHSLAADDPRVSPLHATDHRELAPALVVVAGRDPLRDDGLRYAAALEAAGVPVRTVSYPDAVHGFLAMPRISTDARSAVDEIVTALSD